MRTPTRCNHSMGIRSSARAKCHREAFTLIEVLVVVAIIALLVAILLPSLAKARESTRSSVCMSSLKQMGIAVQMYVSDGRDTLPGPAHFLIYLETHRKWVLESGDVRGLDWAKTNLSMLIGRYLGDRKAKNLDQVGMCPTAERITVADATGQPWYYQCKANYVVNTVSGANARGMFPYYGTSPGYYFGTTNLWGTGTDLAKYFGSLPEIQRPKKLESIRNASAEWMLADAWYWEAAGGGGRGGGVRRVGTWFFDLAAGTSGSVSNGGRLKIPSFPYHNTTQTFSEDGTDKVTGTPRLTSGRTNAAFMDGHAESVRNWKGAANPSF